MSSNLVIHAGRVILPDQGQVAENQRVVVRDGNVVSVEPQSRQLAGADVVDLSDMTLLPGLIDSHTHLTLRHEMRDIVEELRRSPAQCALEAIPNARMKLLSGFTTVREAGSYWAFVDVALRDAIARGDVAGPTMLVPGAMITMTGGAGAITGLAPEVTLPRHLRYGQASGCDAIRDRVRDIAVHGADVIKIFATGAVMSHGNSLPTSTELTLQELEAAVDEAASLGLKVMAHAHSAAGIKNAVEAGVVSIEHGTMLDEETAELMEARGTFLVPTLSVWDCMGEGSHRSADFIAKGKIVADRHGAAFKCALRRGVRVALGSDSVVCPHDTGARELHYMVKFGMTTMEAIQAATVNAASLLGNPQIGSLVPGKRADLIAVRGDPLANIDVLADVSFVMKQGVIYKRPS
jgi:imidazolonepropionase-like amidohydrolase